jgi:hypothetical protein
MGVTRGVSVASVMPDWVEFLIVFVTLLSLMVCFT